MTTFSYPDFDLEPGEFFMCVHCKTVYGDDDFPCETGQLTCRSCGGRGFVRGDALARRSVREKWGPVSGRRFVALPHILLEARGALGFDSVDLTLIAALEMHRHRPDDQVWPSHKRLAVLSGVSTSTVRRRCGLLERRGLLSVERAWAQSGARLSNRYRLAGLHEVLEAAAVAQRDGDDPAKAIAEALESLDRSTTSAPSNKASVVQIDVIDLESRRQGAASKLARPLRSETRGRGQRGV